MNRVSWKIPLYTWAVCGGFLLAGCRDRDPTQVDPNRGGAPTTSMAPTPAASGSMDSAHALQSGTNAADSQTSDTNTAEPRVAQPMSAVASEPTRPVAPGEKITASDRGIGGSGIDAGAPDAGTRRRDQR